MDYFDLYAFIGKEITPPGGTKLACKFLNERYFSSKSERFRYLEVASHTGTLSREIATLNLHEEICGIDISSFAVNRANQLCKRQKLERIEFSVQNAENLRFEDDHFDYVDIGIAWGFFIQDRSKCLKECKRVLKPDGRIIANNLFYMEIPPPELTREVERILGIDLGSSTKYDYNFFYDLMADTFELESELIVEFEGTFTEAEYQDYIRNQIKVSDAAITKLTADEQELFVQEYAKSRFILHMNEEYCLGALQAWKLK